MWSAVVALDVVSVASAGVTGLRVATVAVAVLNALLWTVVAAKRRSVARSQ
jgi:hypothetical protein